MKCKNAYRGAPNIRGPNVRSIGNHDCSTKLSPTIINIKKRYNRADHITLLCSLGGIKIVALSKRPNDLLVNSFIVTMTVLMLKILINRLRKFGGLGD